MSSFTQEERDRIEVDENNMQIAMERMNAVCQEIVDKDLAIPVLAKMAEAAIDAYREAVLHIHICPKHETIESKTDYIENVVNNMIIEAFYIGNELGKVNYEMYAMPARKSGKDTLRKEV